jgi:hypothetical protein
MPWKTFMYKALNTFVDDLFAFIITMPTMHRLACLRDDLIFFCYLYQRWQYGIDAKRPNEYGQVATDEPPPSTTPLAQSAQLTAVDGAEGSSAAAASSPAAATSSASSASPASSASSSSSAAAAAAAAAASAALGAPPLPPVDAR